MTEPKESICGCGAKAGEGHSEEYLGTHFDPVAKKFLKSHNPAPTEATLKPEDKFLCANSIHADIYARGFAEGQKSRSPEVVGRFKADDVVGGMEAVDYSDNAWRKVRFENLSPEIQSRLNGAEVLREIKLFFKIQQEIKNRAQKMGVSWTLAMNEVLEWISVEQIMAPNLHSDFCLSCGRMRHFHSEGVTPIYWAEKIKGLPDQCEGFVGEI